MKKNSLILVINIIVLAAISFYFVCFWLSGVEAANEVSQGQLEIHFFYSRTCPHCLAEQKFLSGIEKKYPQVKINRYNIAEPNTQELLKVFGKKYNVEQYVGLVPLTFVGEDFFLGFDNTKGIGKKIEESIQKQLQGKPSIPDREKINLPIIGGLNISDHSLPFLAVLLGALDGFNICSLGALVLILGLVLALRSRKKILIFGGMFILTTSIVYGALMFLWYQLFSFIASWTRIMEFLIGLLALGGGFYFFKQFLKFKKQGPICNGKPGNKIATKISLKIQDSFQNPTNIFVLVGSILLLAGIITIVEFPCSAAVPTVFTGLLAKSQLSSFLYLFYILLYLFFYLLDEIIVFLVALFTMKLWLASPKFVTWITLIEAVILFLLGFYYLFWFLI